MACYGFAATRLLALGFPFTGWIEKLLDEMG